MRYQHKWDDIDPADVPKAGQENLEATIHRALELGINHIETARGYGSSEMQLGWLLPKLPREKLIVQTKIAPFADPKEFLATFNQSMDYLNLDHVELLSIHGINNRELLDWSMRKGGCLEMARQIQRDGRARHIGFSTHATPDVILEAVNSGGFDYFNVHWYFVNDLNRRAIEAARKLDMGVFIISPNDKGGKLYAPPPKLVELCQPLSPMQFNALYCLARPGVHTLSCGASCPADFDEHLRALAWYDRIEETVAPIEARIREEIHRVLGKALGASGAAIEALGRQWMEHWHEDLPHYVDVPGEINVSEILRLWTYAKSLDLTDWGKMRYNLLGGQAGDWFPGQMAGAFDAAAILEAVQGNPFAEKIPDLLRDAHRLLHDKPVQRLSQSE